MALISSPATRDQPSMQTGTLTPSKSLGGLSSLDAGPEDEAWSGVAATMYEEEEASNILHLVLQLPAKTRHDYRTHIFSDRSNYGESNKS
jgi:hypothetical protein